MGHVKNTLWLSVFAACAAPASAQQMAGYHIGNSLTWDSQPLILPDYAAMQSVDLATGMHINCNMSLDRIITEPTQTCVTPEPSFGYFQDALTGIDLDYITVQPYWTATSTFTTDAYAFAYFDQLLDFNPGNDDTIVYLYQPWGARWFMQNGDWLLPLEDINETTPTSAENAYFITLFQILSANIDRTVRLVPAAPVINEIRDRIYAGEIPGVNSLWHLYRDDIHLNNSLGRFAASITTASVILDCPPFGMHNAWIDEFGPDGYTTATFVAIENAVWDVISADPRTGVAPCLADTNRDGYVTPQDFTAWISAYNIQASIADQNRDGKISPRDFTAWVTNFNNGC